MTCKGLRENDTCSDLTIFRNDAAAAHFQKGLVAEAKTHTAEMAGKCPRPDLARKIDSLNQTDLADVSACVACLALERVITDPYKALDAFKNMIYENQILQESTARSLIA